MNNDQFPGVDYTPKTHYLDQSTDTWVAGPDLPANSYMAWGCAVRLSATRAFLQGDRFLDFDASTGVFTDVFDFPHYGGECVLVHDAQRDGEPVVVVAGGKEYHGTHVAFDSVFEYDPATQAVASLPALPQAKFIPVPLISR